MNRKILKKIIFGVAFLLIATEFLSSQTLPFNHYTFKDGLVSSFINCIFQDSRGYLWMGTDHGLSRFDGLEFQNLTISDGLPNDCIQDIIEDSKGNIWFASSGGGILCLKPGSFQLKPDNFLNFSIKEGLPSNKILCIREDHSGNVWFGTESGLCQFDGKSFFTFSKKDGLPDNFIKALAIDKKGAVWIGTGKGLCRLSNNRFITYTTANGLIHNNARTLAVDLKGNILIGTSGGLSCFRKGTFYSYTTKQGLPNNRIKILSVNKSGKTWIGTENGLSYYSKGTFTNLSTKHGLTDNHILAIFQDSEANTWIGTDKGVSQLISLHISTFSQRDGLANSSVWTITQDRQNRYWFGTSKGLSCYSSRTFKTYTKENGLVGNFVSKLLVDNEDQLWIGTTAGLNIFKNGSLKIHPKADLLPNKTILTMTAAQDGRIFVGTAMGIYCFDKGRFMDPFPWEKASVHAILEDNKKNIWYSNNFALNSNKTYLNKVSKMQDGKYRVTRYSKKDGLPHYFIYSLFEDSRGRIWIGTMLGVACYYNGKFKKLSVHDGLAADACYFFMEDKNRDIWVGTLKGINRIDGDSFEIFSTISSLVLYDINQGASFKDHSGNFWFGTVNGVTRFNPLLITKKNKLPPPVYLTHINVFEKSLPVSAGFQLEYDRNYLRFGFTGLSFTSPGNMTYKYHLTGIDNDWVETKNRTVTYPYLPPGAYRFEVYANNSDGIGSTQSAVTHFKIHPPFWQTWWFRSVTAILLLALLLMLILWRIRKDREKAALEARNKQLVMAQKMELVGILAASAVHDLKNLLSVIINYSKRAARKTNQSTRDEKTNDIGKIQDTAVTAIRVAKQILAFSRRKHIDARAANLPDLLKGIVDTLKINIPPNIEIRIEKTEREITLMLNPTKFQQLVMNLCLNAVQAMPDGGIIAIRLQKTQNHQLRGVLLEISDSGTGIDLDTQKNIFTPLFTTKDPGKGTGLGLFVVKQIVDEYKGKIDVQSQPGKGTTFTIAFQTK